MAVVDRARTNLQKLTGAQLGRAADLFGVAREVNGRHRSAKHLRCAIMGVDVAVEMLGREDFHPKDLKRASAMLDFDEVHFE